MGKRSNFERREADFYPTPRAAVLPLIPYLRGIRTFAEPCAGDGALVRHLEVVRPALRLCRRHPHRSGCACGRRLRRRSIAIITNPPWSRDLMHRLIAHFQNIAPTWLLLDADWAHTKQAAPFLPHCSDIVAIGRVKWIEGSKHSGKDNCAWYRFDARHNSWSCLPRCVTMSPLFDATGICEHCRKAYEPQRSSSRFCSETCRQRAHRNRLSVTSSVTPAPSDSSEVFRFVRHDDVPRFTAEGWELLPALDGTHHGEYSALMRRRIEQD